jgi:aspartyl/asparaginyl-tRNA synthetase
MCSGWLGTLAVVFERIVAVVVDTHLASHACGVCTTALNFSHFHHSCLQKRHTLEFLRGIAHLRPRTNTISGVARVRSALSHATHTFFQGAGFQYVHTPILSASDCEGAGEMFQVNCQLPVL